MLRIFLLYLFLILMLSVVVMLVVLIFVITNFFIDLAYAWLDPRVTLSEEREPLGGDPEEPLSSRVDRRDIVAREFPVGRLVGRQRKHFLEFESSHRTIPHSMGFPKFFLKFSVNFLLNSLYSGVVKERRGSSCLRWRSRAFV